MPFVGRPLDVSGRGGDGTVDKHGDNLIIACTTGHHDPRQPAREFQSICRSAARM
jgi:hypothetical protein